MATIQLERGPDGRFIRLERFRLPGNNESIFTRRFVVVDGQEYEMVGNFMCKYFFELCRADDPVIYVCAASDDGEGNVAVVEGEFLIFCGKAGYCQHVCQCKKRTAKKLLDCGPVGPKTDFLTDILNHPDTIELNPEVFEDDR